MINFILKRDGRKIQYNRQNIATAIWKSLFAVQKVGRNKDLLVGGGIGKRVEQEAAELIIKETNLDKKSKVWTEAQRLSKITEQILIKSNGSHAWKVEEIQDVVEQVLLAAGHREVAEAYILYRNRKQESRLRESLIVNRKAQISGNLEMSENAVAAMAKRYLWKDKEGNVIETPKEAMERVATAVSKEEGKSGRYWKDKYLEIMASFEFVPGGCYFRGAGNKQNGSLANCFVLPVEDSIEKIFDAVKWAAQIHQMGGGTGFNFSHLRPRGDLVRSGGLSSGPINFMKAFDAETQIVMQGGVHRGANMGILNVDHPDIFEFIRAKSVDGEVSNFNISVGAFDRFMKAVKEDKDWGLINPHDKTTVQKIPARGLWNEMVGLAHSTGDPGMIYLDSVNRFNPVLKSLGPIESTNVCIAGDTRIATDLGLLPIKDIAERYRDGGLKIAVDERTGVKRTQSISSAVSSGRKKTVKIITKAGYSLICTPDHQVMTQKGWAEAGKLVIGQDKIYIQQSIGNFSKNFYLPVTTKNKYNLPARWDKNLGLVLGWLVGDGWLRTGDKNCRVGFTFGKDSQEAYNIIEPILQNWYREDIKTIQRKREVKHLSFHSKSFCNWFAETGVLAVKAEQKRVPESIFTAPKEAVTGFLQGLFSADGTVRTRTDGCKSYWACLTSKSKNLLEDVQLLLLQFGIKSSIYDRSRKPRSGMSAYIKKNGDKVTYQTDGKLFELGIFGNFREKFRTEIGFIISSKQKKLDAAKDQKYYRQDFSDEILSVKDNGQTEVFDLTEPATHSMLANGLYIHNCGEQPLHPFDVCNLGSINLSKFVVKPWWEDRNSQLAIGNSLRGATNNGLRITDCETNINWSRLEEVVRTAVRFLDDGIDASTYPIPQITDMAHRLRRIGLGVMGWADMLVKLGVRYDSDEGIEFAKLIMKFIQEVSWDESHRLAKEKGAFPLWKDSYFKTKVRNVAVTTIAPTGTISMIADCSSGIEPYFALEYTKNVVDKKGLKYTNRYYEEAKKAMERWQDGLDGKDGNNLSTLNTLNHSTILSSIFRTSHQISPDWHVRMQAAFQKYTDNAVSKTINFPADATVSDIEKAYMLAWELGCKGITVYRDGSREGQILEINEQKAESRKQKAEIQIQSQMKITPLSQRAYQVERRKITEDLADGHCPECGSLMEESEGCSLCRNCGFSKCSL
jgi:ribonucleoside-diphosphate reductase alpha chain